MQLNLLINITLRFLTLECFCYNASTLAYSLIFMPIITVNNLTKKFGDFTAVHDISLKVEPGEIFAFLGPNGAGKSTTIKMMTTMLRPTSGQLLLNGHDVTRDQDKARKSFGIVFQD